MNLVEIMQVVNFTTLSKGKFEILSQICTNLNSQNGISTFKLKPPVPSLAMGRSLGEVPSTIVRVVLEELGDVARLACPLQLTVSRSY